MSATFHHAHRDASDWLLRQFILCSTPKVFLRTLFLAPFDLLLRYSGTSLTQAPGYNSLG